MTTERATSTDTGVRITESGRYVVGDPVRRRGQPGPEMTPDHPVLKYPGQKGDKIRPAGPTNKVGRGF